MYTIGISQYCGYMMEAVTSKLIDFTRVTDL